MPVGLNSSATRAKKENGSMPESPGPREDRQACPEEGRYSLAFIHRVPVPPSVPLDRGVGFPCPDSIHLQLGPLCSGGKSTDGRAGSRTVLV